MFWHRRYKLNWAPSEFLLPSHYCGLGAGSIPLRTIVNKKQMRDDRVIYVAGYLLMNSLVDVQDSRGASFPQNVKNYNF